MRTRAHRVVVTLVAVMALASLAVTAAYARQIWAGGYGRTPPRFPTAKTFAGYFTTLNYSPKDAGGSWSSDPGPVTSVILVK